MREAIDTLEMRKKHLETEVESTHGTLMRAEKDVADLKAWIEAMEREIAETSRAIELLQAAG